MRAETRAQHEAVEALLPLTSPDLTREMYGDLLVCMHTIVHTWEEWALARAPVSLKELVLQRRRGHLLEADLKFLQKEAVSKTESPLAETQANLLDRTLAGMEFEAAYLGAMYVVEGSTLGGQYIAKHVEEKFGFEPGRGDAYFRGYGQQTAFMWRSFQAILKQLPDDSTIHVVGGAKVMFQFFADHLKMCPPVFTHLGKVSSLSLTARRL